MTLYWENNHLQPPRSLAERIVFSMTWELMNITYREASISSCYLHAAGARYIDGNPIEYGRAARTQRVSCFQQHLWSCENFNISEVNTTLQDANLPPASMSRTRRFGFSERRDARTHPAVPGRVRDHKIHCLRNKYILPPPTMMKSHSSN